MFSILFIDVKRKYRGIVLFILEECVGSLPRSEAGKSDPNFRDRDWRVFFYRTIGRFIMCSSPISSLVSDSVLNI